MAARITARRMSGLGKTHEHITRLKGYDDVSGQNYDGTREEWYQFVVGGGKAYVQDDYGRKADLVARTMPNGTRYVQTRRDGVLTDNLLALPLY